MNVYLAAAYGRREEMLEIAKLVRDAGHDVTARWIEGNHDTPPEGIAVDSPEHLAWAAADDVEDIALRSDCILSITGGGTRSRGGRHVEFGIGLSMGLRMIVVGEREHVFHYLPQVEHYDTIEDALAAMREPVAV